MVAVVCTAFVVVFLALGIVRFRAAQRRSTREDLQAGLVTISIFFIFALCKGIYCLVEGKLLWGEQYRGAWVLRKKLVGGTFFGKVMLSGKAIPTCEKIPLKSCVDFSVI